MITKWRGFHAVLYIKDHGHIAEGQWRWVSPSRARQLVDSGVCEYYDPEKVAERRKALGISSSTLKVQRVEPKYTPVPVEDLTMDHLWRKIFVSMKKAGYPVRESMTKSELLELRDAEK